jgi:hypothetical protein
MKTLDGYDKAEWAENYVGKIYEFDEVMNWAFHCIK